MPLRRILVKDSDGDAPTVLQADSIGNRKPKCTSFGYCDWSGGDKYKYQIPCDGNWDCVFYKDGVKGTNNLVQGTCKEFKGGEDPNGFGNETGKGCRASYYEFYLNIDGTKSSYKPAVQVLDNWGWCSGSCDSGISSYYTGNGCYQDWSNPDCDATQSKAWVNYGGTVKVQ